MNLKKIIILNDTSKGDSRTSGTTPNLKEVYNATETHINDVDNTLEYWKSLISERMGKHDYTKLENFENEYGYLVTHNIRDEEFLKSNWWHKHITEERHHLIEYVPIDVNLIDVLEMISDRVTAEKGRTGEINTNYLKLDKDTLYRAYWNTVKLLDDNTKRE